jgi:hypothetical protein
MVNHSHTRIYLIPPGSIANIFGICLNRADSRFKTFIRAGAIDVIWSLWLCSNEKVLNDKNYSLMQIIQMYGFTLLKC